MTGTSRTTSTAWQARLACTNTYGVLIEPLRAGLAKLIAEPDRFRAFNPANGWGDYEGLVAFVQEYLHACEENPDADVSVSR